MEERKWRQYEVYHMKQRDAQIYTDDPDKSKNINQTDDCWRDYRGDLLMDIVLAENEEEAIRMVSSNEGIHENNLFAVEHVLNIKEVGTSEKGNLSYALVEVSAYSTEHAIGLEIQIPNGIGLVITFRQQNGIFNWETPEINFSRITSTQ